jgi:hypothetical protein
LWPLSINFGENAMIWRKALRIKAGDGLIKKKKRPRPMQGAVDKNSC